MNDRVFRHTEAHKLEDPERLKWLPPAEVLQPLRLSAGMKVADVGAGTGYFAIPIAQAVSESGEVLAVDLQPEMLELLRQKLAYEHAPGNISLLLGKASHLPLPDHVADLVFYANIWHELDDCDIAFAEAVRVCAAAGRIAILDWRDDCSPPPGPPQDHRISEGAVTAFLTSKGCRNVACRHVGQFGYLVTAELDGLRPSGNPA